MHELEVIVLDEPRTVSTPGELAEVIGSRVDGGNHFMIASATCAYPMLDLLVRDQYAVLHYFAREGVAGDQAASNLADPPDEVELPAQLDGRHDVDTGLDSHRCTASPDRMARSGCSICSTAADSSSFSTSCSTRRGMVAADLGWITEYVGEQPGISSFLRDGDEVFHTYSTYGRGVEVMMNGYRLLDITALGRQEDWEEPKGRTLDATPAGPSYMS